MNLAGWRFLVFALVGAGGIVLLASIGAPGRQEESIDRHTGEKVVVVRTVADALHEARNSGNARTALERVRARMDAFPDHPVLRRLEAYFEAELADASTPPPPLHPDATVIAAEQARRAELQSELTRRAGERLDREALLALLSDLEADVAVGAATEQFFAPLARWRPEHPESSLRVDEMAARTLARLEDPESSQNLDDLLKVVAAFRAEVRPRARIRWLLRAYGKFPSSPDLRDLLLQTYLEYGRLAEAFLVLGTALNEEPRNLELWQWRAKVAGWLGRAREEAEAQEFVLGSADDPAIRERLIALYRFSGQPGKAVPHALVLAEGSDDPEVLERPALLALAAGDVDQALDIYEELAQASDDPARWRERIIEHALQDLRIERVIRELKILRARYPHREYEARLEDIYRRRGMTRELATLLDARLQLEPDNRELVAEVVTLYASLGEQERVKKILVARLQRNPLPREFFSNLPLYRALELPDLEQHALEAAADKRLPQSDLGFVLEQIRPFLDEPGYRRVAARAARRFPDDEAARTYLILLVDLEPTDRERAAAAKRLARDFPGRAAYLKAWIERAAWAGDTEGEIEAREEWLRRTPDDEENRRKLGHLFAAVARPGDAVEHWLYFAEKEGVGSEATLRLIDVLFAAGRLEEAMRWLERRAELPGATLQDRLDVADQLFGSDGADRALRFYLAALDDDPDHPHALLRVGLIRSWGNDPRGAIPFFERRLRVSDEQRAEVRYFLGEANWAIQEKEAGRRYHALALEELQARADRTIDQDIMVAKMLARSGRIDEARPIFERALVEVPDNVDVILDYADSMVTVGDAVKARELANRALALAPYKSRTMLLDGKVAFMERRYEDAARILQATLDKHGPNAGTEAELGRASELAGRWQTSADAYRRSLVLQPRNQDVSRSLQRLADRLAGLVHASLGYRSAGDDSVLELWAKGSSLLGGERTRISAALGAASYTGRAAAVDNGLTDVEESVIHLQATVYHRFGRLHTVGGGIALYPGAPGNVQVGGWADVLFAEPEPYRAVWARVYGNLLLEEPAAAVGLGGRRSGVRAGGQMDLAEHFWVAAEAGYAALSIDRPTGGSARDGFFEGIVTFGWRIREGDTRVADPVRISEARLPGLLGTHVEPEPQPTTRWTASVWANLQVLRLLDDEELATLIPIGNGFSYLVVGGRADFHVAEALGVKVEAYAGADLENSEQIFGVEGGLTWRPSHRTELTLVAGLGSALGREDDTESLHVRLGFTRRW